jgi:hypothetical protein
MNGQQGEGKKQKLADVRTRAGEFPSPPSFTLSSSLPKKHAAFRE